MKLVKFGLGFTGAEVAILLTGMAVAFVVSILAIKFLTGYIRRNMILRLRLVSRIVLGVLVLGYFIGKYYSGR